MSRSEKEQETTGQELRHLDEASLGTRILLQTLLTLGIGYPTLTGVHLHVDCRGYGQKNWNYFHISQVSTQAGKLNLDLVDDHAATTQRATPSHAPT